MSRQLTSTTSLDNLKKEAKRWLKALRAGDAEARARLRRAFADAPTDPGLRDVQHALAREYGLAGWTALTEALAEQAVAKQDHAERVARFLEFACPDHHVRGGPAHVMARHAAERILQRHPEVARDSIFTAVVCGDLQEVERILSQRPSAAGECSSAPNSDRAAVGTSADLFRERGPNGWPPLLYLCFTRLSFPAVRDNAVAIARALLDRGADPNAHFMAGDSRYTPLVGVIGEGEEGRPPHPQREALTRLLLERGAEPFDKQVLYNLHARGDVLWFLELIHVESIRRGHRADWEDPNWSMLDMGPYGCGARYLLGLAVQRNDLPLAEWLLVHGASPHAPAAPDPRVTKRSLHEEALRRGFTDLAELLQRHGATACAAPQEGLEAFMAACFRLDRAAAKAILDLHPEYLSAPQPLFAAARQDRTDVAALLLELGMSPDLADPQGGQRPLHAAAYHDAPSVAALLIEHSATVDPRDTTYGATPLGMAVWANNARMIQLLGRHSRDIWNLTFTGHVERLRELLHEQPQLARVRSEDESPLLWLPDDETRARQIVELFVSLGADVTLRNKQGLSAADIARKRGMDEVAELLSR